MSDGYPLMEAWMRDRMFTQGQMDEALRMRIVRTSVVDGDIHLYFRADRG